MHHLRFDLGQNFIAFICSTLDIEVLVVFFASTPLSAGRDYLPEEWLFESMSGGSKSTLLNIMVTSMHSGLAVFFL